MMHIGGKVFVDEDEVGTFTLDSDDQLIMELNGGRWTAQWVFQWVLEQGKSIRFEPETVQHRSL